MHPLLYLGVLLAFFPVCIYLPTHLVFRRFLPQAAHRREAAALREPVEAAV